MGYLNATPLFFVFKYYFRVCKVLPKSLKILYHPIIAFSTFTVDQIDVLGTKNTTAPDH